MNDRNWEYVEVKNNDFHTLESYFPITIEVKGTNEKKVIETSDKIPIGKAFKIIKIS